MRFDVNGQSYVLSFDPQEGRWYLLTPGIAGRVKAIPVLDDAAGFMPTSSCRWEMRDRRWGIELNTE